MGKTQPVDKSNVSQHASSTPAEMDGAKRLCVQTGKGRISEQLSLLQARGKVKPASASSSLKKVKKAPMKKAQKVKKMKKMDRARIISEKEEQRVTKQEQKSEKKKIRKVIWE
ncbi:hypothetical protein INT44_005312 [Umbelopsis vinacea]|uniref:Uncharacterized protein n=1 Tax=Umbelopsis vinacea TaxID=44442 RepID=A0A8H7Q7V4_9FUNG|nr:hypothetical protein INT44_005312 [Umbelopsis vinacea]